MTLITLLVAVVAVAASVLSAYPDKLVESAEPTWRMPETPKWLMQEIEQ